MKWESQLFKCDRRGFRVSGRDCDMYFQDGNGEQCPADCPTRTGKKAATEGTPTEPTVQRKVCKTCKEPHDINDFPINYRSKDGHMAICKECFSAKVSDGHSKNKKPEKSVRKSVKTETVKAPDVHKITLDFSKRPDIYSDLIESAETDFRSPDMQILAILDKTFKLN